MSPDPREGETMPGYREITVAGEGRPRRPAPARAPAADWRGALAGTLSGAAALCRARPGTMLGALGALGAAGLVCFNALSHQAGPHPAPILPKVAAAAAKEPAREPARDAARSAGPAAPKQAARDAIGDLIRADETTASVTPKPVAAKAAAIKAAVTKTVATKPEAADGAVLRAQRALAKLGYGAVKADGAMGPSTRAAIEKFERSAKLPVTGEASGRTLRELVSRAGQG
jgi:hypothetical protein